MGSRLGRMRSPEAVPSSCVVHTHPTSWGGLRVVETRCLQDLGGAAHRWTALVDRIALVISYLDGCHQQPISLIVVLWWYQSS